MLMTFWRRKKIGTKGQALVEAAIILPLLILLVMGIIQYGFIFFTYATGLNVSREAARAAAISGTAADGVNLADELIPPLMQSTQANVVTIINDVNGHPAMQADIKVKVPLIVPKIFVVVTEFTCTTTMRVGG
jgi:Flp pilus assembly protein TadG